MSQARRKSTGCARAVQQPKTGAGGALQDRTLPPIKSPAEHADFSEVEKLDSWFEGVSQPSRRIQDLVRRKRRQHDALLRQLRQELFRERSDAQRTVCFVSTNLRTELDKASLMVKLKGQDLAELCAGAASAVADRQCDPRAVREAVATACDVVQQLTDQRKRAVDAFYDLLLDVEAEHQKRAAAALSKYAAALARNGHLPPQRLQPVLDAERQEVGELHLQNVISFGDLRLCLNMHAEQDRRRFKEGVENSRRLCSEQCQRTTLSALQEAGNRSIDEYIKSTSTGRESVCCFEKKVNELKHALCWCKPYPFTEDDVNCWESNVNSCVKQMDTAVGKISVGLVEGLTQMKTFSTDEVERLKQFTMDSGLCSSNTFNSVYQNVCLPLLDHIARRTTQDPTDFMVCSRQLLQVLACEIDSFACLMKDAGKLWDHHSMLRNSGRARTLQNLTNKMQDRGKCVEAKERRITLIVEKSRQETNKRNLEENVERIFRILDEVKCSYENMKKDETVILEEYASLVTHDLESLRSSTELFLKKYGTSQQKSLMTVDLTQVFNVCEDIMIYIELQRTRHYKDIEVSLTQKCERIVQQDGENWILEQLNHLHTEYCTIFESHSLRYDKIRSQVQLVRLEEIDEHSRLVDHHKEIILRVSKKIEKALEGTCVKEFQVFKKFSSDVKLLREKGLQDVLAESVKSIISQVETSYDKCKESVKTLNNEYQTMVLMEIQKMKKDNNDFLKSLRHFSDGGTFADSEVTNIKSDMVNLELDTEANGSKNIMALKERSKECCSEAMKHVKICVKDLQLHLDSLKFMENIAILIGESQAQLRKHVLALKYGGKLLKEQVTELVDTWSKKDSTLTITNKWRCVQETVSKRQKWLVCENVIVKESSKTAETKCSQLLEYGENCTFLQLISRLLIQSMQEIQRRANVFLQEFHKKTACNSFDEEDVRKFIADITSKYKLYQEQCIEVWINELTDLLEMIQKLRNNHQTVCEKILHDIHEELSLSLNNQTTKLNDDLIILRRNYQRYQVETMTRLTLKQGFPESQYMFSTVCAEFEKTSRLLCQNIKKLVDNYKIYAAQLLDNYKQDLDKQKSSITTVSKELFSSELQKSLVERIEMELNHLSQFYSLQLPHNECVFPHMNSSKNIDAEAPNRNICPQVAQAIESLIRTAEEYWSQITQDEAKRTSWMSTTLAETVETALKGARALVHNKTCEVQHLYEQYKNMAEELRTKWKSTLENLQQLHLPT